ncbi:hypothetical protein BU24DRAFT_467827 [Aaosphaeria arxii CBS 175.79]|uniref:Uncharacterized protein n=1 Tax=Aaosphaeria arxii CBS 175.79 TaxID=1450172 RepID=A0A6A5X969_9PLEO|nr:uncharacterized protein BU24DRAFT_467827 [Aaosphaeria arxii CBS 175.79]KAF2009449.1 hypothetical protein BU24DRAFT_467827 [Aaosphaeria arxii CBS 175.79]
MAITTTTHAHPLNHPLHARAEGSCSTTHLPTESTYLSTIPLFCRHFSPPAKISTSSPVTLTYTLPSYSSPDVNWVYKISIPRKGDNEASTEVNEGDCVARMGEVLTEGKLGGAYCVVDGTEDVLFKGGSADVAWGGLVNGGVVRFESYRRKGDL